MKFEIIESLDGLLEKADKWNELWERSGSESPQARAETIATWVRHFSQPSRFRAVVVTSGDGWHVGLPILLDRRGPIRLATLLRNDVTDGGSLVWDRESLSGDVADALVDGLKATGAKLLWFDKIPAEEATWRKLRESLEQRGLESELRLQHGVGIVLTTDSWEWYESHLSKNHRKNIRKALGRLEKIGRVEFRDSLELDSSACARWWDTFVDIEDDNWKGHAGSSLKRSERVGAYYQQLYADMLQSGHLELLQLTLDGEPIAAEFGYHGKQTYFSNKVGYRDQYSDFSPGHLLMYLQIKHYHEQGHRRKLHAISPITHAMTRWANALEHQYRLTASLSRVPGNQLAKAINVAVKSIRRIKGRTEWVAPELPASGSLERLARSEATRFAP
ncbi:MAG: GNAT family N-acetyltransferase [Planctomycetales bacterium]|nr:GNAT family N-acetyltransferase [Planctomycetales bacterium]